MNNLSHLKTVSNQSVAICKLLQKRGQLTAQEIADELSILPNAVYRTANKLVDLGMIQQLNTYPAKYAAINMNSAMNWYLLAMARNFKQEFNLDKKPPKDANLPSISFIKDRKHCIEKELIDLKNTKKTYNYIVSGHDVPENVFHETRKAVMRGVKVRKIIHQKSQIQSQYNKDLITIGVETRYLPDIQLRMFVFDSQVAIMTSYDDVYNHKGFGVRFGYAPLALQMDQLFEQNWQQAQPIGS